MPVNRYRVAPLTAQLFMSKLAAHSHHYRGTVSFSMDGNPNGVLMCTAETHTAQPSFDTIIEQMMAEGHTIINTTFEERD